MFYLKTHSTYFYFYGYMASNIWLRTILIVRKETRCRHIGYSFRLAARVLLYASSHRQNKQRLTAVYYYRRSKTLRGPRTTNVVFWVHFGWGSPDPRGPWTLSSLSTRLPRPCLLPTTSPTKRARWHKVYKQLET